MLAIHDLETSLKEHGDKITQLQLKIHKMVESNNNSNVLNNINLIMLIIFCIGVFQALLFYIF